MRLTVCQGAEEPEHLPSGIFLVDRLVTSRPSKTHSVSIHAYNIIHTQMVITILLCSCRISCAVGRVSEASWILDTDVIAPAVE